MARRTCFSSQIALATVIFCFAIADDPTVSVRIGSIATVIGYTQTNPDGFVFYGIPYAQPPIGQNRFAPTQKKDPSGRILAFHFGSACHQASPGNYDEDCLFMNIWTPKMTNFTSNKYPVFFWIHGGGFVVGSGNLDTEGILKNLIARGVIVVSFNYRLGAFGFFSTRDSIVPGNMGMLDQIEALHWVQRYISYFGGDPNAVTIVGASAGGESVSLLTLSPLTKVWMDYGAIGSSLLRSMNVHDPGQKTGVFSDFPTQTDKVYLKEQLMKAAAHFRRVFSPTQIRKQIPASRLQLNSVAQLLPNGIRITQHRWHKCYSTEWGGWPVGWDRWAPVRDDNVFPDRLENLAKKRAPIPVLLGNCKDEWLFAYQYQLQHDPNFPNSFIRQTMIDQLRDHYELNFYNNSATVRQQTQAVYIDSKPYSDQDHASWIVDSIQLYSEMVFTGPTYRDAMNFRQIGSPVYLYSFDYLAPGAMPLLKAPYRGVPHSWEVQYLFGEPAGWQITSDDIATMNYFGLYWTNFVKFGNPTPSSSPIIWPQLGTNGEFMSMGPVPTPSNNFHPLAASFWTCTVPAIEGYKPAFC